MVLEVDGNSQRIALTYTNTRFGGRADSVGDNTAAKHPAEHLTGFKWQPGVSPNPKGRPKGSRDSLSSWERHRRARPPCAALLTCRQRQPPVASGPSVTLEKLLQQCAGGAPQGRKHSATEAIDGGESRSPAEAREAGIEAEMRWA